MICKSSDLYKTTSTDYAPPPHKNIRIWNCFQCLGIESREATTRLAGGQPAFERVTLTQQAARLFTTSRVTSFYTRHSFCHQRYIHSLLHGLFSDASLDSARTQRRWNVHIGFWWENPNGNNRVEDMRIDVMTILKWIGWGVCGWVRVCMIVASVEFRTHLRSCHFLYKNSVPWTGDLNSTMTVFMLKGKVSGRNRQHTLAWRTKKPKSVPLQAWSGPEGSRKLRFPDFMTTAQEGGKVVSLTHRPPLPPRKCS